MFRKQRSYTPYYSHILQFPHFNSKSHTHILTLVYSNIFLIHLKCYEKSNKYFSHHRGPSQYLKITVFRNSSWILWEEVFHQIVVPPPSAIPKIFKKNQFINSCRFLWGEICPSILHSSSFSHIGEVRVLHKRNASCSLILKLKYSFL